MSPAPPPQVHYFIASWGESVKGAPQAHKDDRDILGNQAVARKCPKILNAYTKVQPRIDMNNRWRQDILAMEERFVTQSYPLRLFTTVFGVMIVDAYLAHKSRYPSQLTFREWCAAAAYDGMHNSIDADACEGCDAGDTPVDRRDDPLSPRLSSQREKHRLVRISSVVGWQGANRQRCAVCHMAGVGWCCVACSGSSGIVPIHRADQSDPRSGHCLKLHQRLPDQAPLTTHSLARQVAGRSRARARGRGRPRGS